LIFITRMVASKFHRFVLGLDIMASALPHGCVGISAQKIAFRDVTDMRAQLKSELTAKNCKRTVSTVALRGPDLAYPTWSGGTASIRIGR
jgi:hypothetical protein